MTDSSMNDVFRDYGMEAKLEKYFAQKDKGDLAERVAGLSGFAEDRKELLLDILLTNKEMKMPESLDVLLFAAHALYPEDKSEFNVPETIYSTSDLYEYDPKKNGCNIIKHGMSFREVASQVGGALIVPIDHKGGSRNVMFTKVSKARLSYPCKGFKTERFLVASITANESSAGGIRFVSTTKVSTKSEKKFKEGLMNLLKTIYPDDKEQREAFVEVCIADFKKAGRGLFPDGLKSIE